MLEGHVDLIVGNIHHIKNVPGRRTDVKDVEWIAQLVRHGLVAGSFVPPPAVRDLRELLRHRHTLIETRTVVRNRVLKLFALTVESLTPQSPVVRRSKWKNGASVGRRRAKDLVVLRSLIQPPHQPNRTAHPQFRAPNGRPGGQRRSTSNMRPDAAITVPGHHG